MHHAPNKCCVFHRNHPYDHIILSVKTWWKSIKIYNPAISIPLFFHKHNVLIQTLAPQRHIDDHRNPKRSQSPLPLKLKLHFCFLCSKHMNLCRYENVSSLHLEENAFRKIPQAHVYNPRHVFSIRVWNARKFSLLLPRRKQLWVILGILEFIAMRGGWFNFFFLSGVWKENSWPTTRARQLRLHRIRTIWMEISCTHFIIVDALCVWMFGEIPW